MDVLTRTKINLEIARKRNFKCALCGRDGNDVEFAISKSGYFCFQCCLILNVMSVLSIVILFTVLLINSLQ